MAVEEVAREPMEEALEAAGVAVEREVALMMMMPEAIVGGAVSSSSLGRAGRLAMEVNGLSYRAAIDRP